MGNHKLPAYADDTQAAKFLDSMDSNTVERYELYFNSIKPDNETDMFRRALFAFASVHTAWQANVEELVQTVRVPA